MAPDPLLPALLEAAPSRGFSRDEATLTRLLAWMDGVLEVGQQLNLTAARTREAALDGILLSALAVTAAVDVPPAVVVDLGTGNGLPGVAAALAWPEARVLLVERRRKKADAVRRLLAAQAIPNAEVVVADGRELARVCPEVRRGVDLVTVRAVGRLDATTEIAAPWVRTGGRIAHWKGRNLSEEERLDGERQARRAGLVVMPLLRFGDRAGPGHLIRYARKEEG